MNKSGHIDDCAPYIAAMWAQSRWQLSQPRHRGVNVQVIHSVPKACWFVGSDRNYTAMLLEEMDCKEDTPLTLAAFCIIRFPHS